MIWISTLGRNLVFENSADARIKYTKEINQCVLYRITN